MNTDIAVVGLSIDLPQVRTLGQLDSFLRAGRCAITSPNPRRLADLGCTEPIGPTSLIEGYDQFDPEFFGISPGEAVLLDPHQRRALQLAVEAFQSAGLRLETLRGNRCSVYLSGYKGDWRCYTRADPSLAAHLGASHATVAGRISWALDLHGPATVIDSGCCSSLLAVRQACTDLRDGLVDVALAGGIVLYLSLRSRVDGDIEVASEDGFCRSYDADARGTANGEGGALIVLKRLDEALADGHEILGMIKGFGVTHSGRRSVGMAAPSPAAQIEAITQAWQGVDLGTVDVIEGHGSGTRLGDLVEARALDRAFGERPHPVYLGSLKSNFGHADHAAGILGLAKAIASVRCGCVYPTVNFLRPNEVVAASPVLRVLDEAVPWPDTGVRRAGVTSLGLTGTNVHVAVEAGPGAVRTDPSRVVIALSGRSEWTVAEHARRVAGELRDAGGATDLAALSDTLLVGFDAEPWRTAAVVQGRTGALRYLRRVADGTVAPTRVPDVVGPPATSEPVPHEFALAQRAVDAFVAGHELDWPAIRAALGYPAETRRCLVAPRPFAERRFWPDLVPNRPRAQPAAADPMIETETDLATVFDATWREVLGVESVADGDDFFALGGNSVLALKLTTLLAERAHRFVDLPTFYSQPTAGQLRGWLPTAEEYRSGNAFAAAVHAPAGPGWLSYGQEALWYIDRAGSGGVAYSVPTDTGLCGSLDIAAFRKAIADFAMRHEVLRSHYIEVDGMPQLAVDPEPVELEIIDLVTDGPADPEERHKRARKIIRQRVAWPFDLATGPLFRATLIKWDADEYVLALNSHHSIDDGWTPRILRRDLAELYRAALAGQPPKLPRLALQYSDYAAWQRRRLNGPHLDLLLDYWGTRLKGVGPIELPTDRPRPAVQTTGGDRITFTVGAPAVKGLREIASRSASSLFSAILAAFRILLFEITGQSDIAIGVSTVGRNRPEIQELFGFFNNSVVLRETVSPEADLRSAIRAERDGISGALAHDDLPFSVLVERLRPDRDPSRHPIFQVGMTFQSLPASSDVDGTPYQGMRRSTRWRSVHHGVVDDTAKWDLDLPLHETEGSDELDGELRFSTDLFDRSTVEAWTERYQRILRELAARTDPELRTVADVVSGPARALPRDGTPAAPPSAGGPDAGTRSSTVERVLAIWRDMLGGETRPDSDFFQSGGHSLLAIRMLVEVRDTMGVSVDLLDFMLRPTPTALAALITPETRPTEPGSRRLVALNDARAEGPPLYLMHPSGGTWTSYVALAERLATPVKSTQCRQPDLTDVTSWPEFVGAYTRAVLDDSGGPYLLGGWSLGAYAAWTVAAQLRQAGRDVAGVIVIDAAANNHYAEKPLNDSHVMLRRMLMRQDIVAPPTRTFKELYDFAVGIGFIDGAICIEQLDDFFAVARHNDGLLAQAILTRLDVPVTVFAASDTAMRHTLPPDLGWSRLSGAVRSATVLDGTHFDLLNTHVDTLARVIAEHVAEL